MSALLLSMALAATGYAEAFWARDLGALHRALEEDALAGAPGPHAALFRDLVALASCQELPELEDAEPDAAVRRLVRVEAARRGRLGEAAARSGTLWRDLSSAGFFRREVRNPDEERTGELLRWPDEGKPWPGEVLVVGEAKWECAAAPAPSNELSLLEALPPLGSASSFFDELGSRLSYHRAALLIAAGRVDEAREVAKSVQPSLLEAELAPYARLLRVALGADAPAMLLPLAEHPFPPAESALVRANACAARLSERRFREAVSLSGPCEPAASPSCRYLAYCRALSHEALGEPDAAVEAVLAGTRAPGADPSLQPMREIALSVLATRPFDEAAQRTLEQLSPPSLVATHLRLLGARALRVGNLSIAKEAAQRLSAQAEPGDRARGLALEAELAFAVRDARRFDAAIAGLFDEEAFSRQRAREERDRAVVELLQTLVTRLSAHPDVAWQRRVEARLQLARERVGRRHAAALEALAAAGRARPPKETSSVAVGEVSLSARRSILPPPSLAFSWPEPRSLLAIPAPDGTWRSWFSAPAGGRDNEVTNAN